MIRVGQTGYATVRPSTTAGRNNIMLGDLGGWHLILILGIVVLLFGSTKLPSLARGIGQSMKIFKSEMKADEPVVPTAAPTAAAPAATPVVPVVPAPGDGTHHTA